MIERTRCAVQPHPDRVGVRLLGELDISNRSVMDRVLDGLATAPTDVYLDLAGLSFIDVGAMAALAAFAVRHRPYRVVVQNPSSVLARVLPMVWAGSGIELE